MYYAEVYECGANISPRSPYGAPMLYKFYEKADRDAFVDEHDMYDGNVNHRTFAISAKNARKNYGVHYAENAETPTYYGGTEQSIYDKGLGEYYRMYCSRREWKCRPGDFLKDYDYYLEHCLYHPEMTYEEWLDE